MKCHSLNDAIKIVENDLRIISQLKEHDIFAPALVGPPGIGKSMALINKVQKMYDKVIIYSLGITDSDLEFIGLPKIIRKVEVNDPKDLENQSIQELETKWIIPDRLKQAKEAKRALIIFDDFHLMNEYQQGILQQILTNGRSIHTHVMENTDFVFIGNRIQDNAGGFELNTAGISRLHIIELEPTKEKLSEEWIRWSERSTIRMKNGEIHTIHPVIIELIRNKPELIYNFDPDIEIKPFAAPRTWKNASLILAQYEKANDTEFLIENFEAIFSGIVGDKAATELLLFYESYTDFDINTIIDSTISFNVIQQKINKAINKGNKLLFLYYLARAITQKVISYTSIYVNRVMDEIGAKTERLEEAFVKLGRSFSDKPFTADKARELLNPSSNEYDNKLTKKIALTMPSVILDAIEADRLPKIDAYPTEVAKELFKAKRIKDHANKLSKIANYTAKAVGTDTALSIHGIIDGLIDSYFNNYLTEKYDITFYELKKSLIYQTLILKSFYENLKRR